MLRKSRWVVGFTALMVCSTAFAQPDGEGRGPGGGGRFRQGEGGPGQGGGRRGGMGMGMGMGGRMGGGQTSLLQLSTMDPVQTELGLTDEQKTKLDALTGELREKLRGQISTDIPLEERAQKVTEGFRQISAEFKSKLPDFLDDVQIKRLQQIFVQVQGTQALEDPDVVAALKLTDDQKEKISAANKEYNQKAAELFRGLAGGPGGGRGPGGRGPGGGGPGAGGPGAGERGNGNERTAALQEVAEKREALNTERESAINGILTAEQKTAFEDLKGEKFDTSTIRQGGGFGGGRGGFPGGERRQRPDGERRPRPEGERPNRPDV
ncbi:hypothetical protein [Planctomicrobium sp. SH664]|uniref:hypothetical protein n=1 Tax=Planctomicrobium sp. SH664 TaxID=3448125 RepID=UPI003F5BF6A9